MCRTTPKRFWKLLRRVPVGWQVPADSHHGDVRSHRFYWVVRQGAALAERRGVRNRYSHDRVNRRLLTRADGVVTFDEINDRIRAENQ